MAGVTSKEIAKALGISQAAVSLALNGKDGISDATRRLVIETARKMGYNPSKLALLQEKRKRICFVFYVDRLVSIAENTSFSSFVLQGAESAASSLGYSVLVRYVKTDGSCAEQLSDVIGDVDGFIIMGTDIGIKNSADIKEFLESLYGKPAVIIDSHAGFGIADCVNSDNLGGARLGAEYLIERGCRRIGYIRSRIRNRNFEQREEALRSVLSAVGLEPEIILDTDVSFDETYNCISEYLKENRELLPDAFFAENDIIAAAALRAFNAFGIKIPETVSVIGFDDLPICELSDPKLTTVHLNKEQLGNAAVNILSFRFMSDTDSTMQGAMQVSIETKLKIRDSVR